MTRTVSLFHRLVVHRLVVHRLVALLAVALLALAAGPAAAAVVADAVRPDCCDHPCPPPAADASTCCAQAPAVPHDLAPLPVLPVHDGVPTELMTETAVPRVLPRVCTKPHDTGPPAGPRRHLALSVFLV